MSDYPQQADDGLSLFVATGVVEAEPLVAKREKPKRRSLKRAKPKPEREFDGSTFDYMQDFERLTSNLERVAHLMADGEERTLSQIAKSTHSSEAGASARLRDLRKDKFKHRFGIADVESRRIEGGLWVYRVVRVS